MPTTCAWYACYTHSRCEKKVDSLLRRTGIESFLPLAPRKRQWHDREKLVLFPLFPSYVFARISSDNVLAILKTPGVATIVRFDGVLAAIPDTEIENITKFARAIRDGYEPPRLVEFEKGQPVRVASGPLKGVEGVVIRTRGRARVLVGLQTIGIGFEVDVPSNSLISSKPSRSPREDVVVPQTRPLCASIATITYPMLVPTRNIP